MRLDRHAMDSPAEPERRGMTVIERFSRVVTASHHSREVVHSGCGWIDPLLRNHLFVDVEPTDAWRATA